LFKVVLYETEDGKTPVEDWIISLDPKMQAKLIAMLELLEEKGNALRKPYTESLGEGIFELRVIQGNNISRALFFFYVNQRIIVTNGFIKKQRKTPSSEIQIAKERRLDFLRQEKNKI